jgi:hypothetical protein
LVAPAIARAQRDKERPQVVDVATPSGDLQVVVDSPAHPSGIEVTPAAVVDEPQTTRFFGVVKVSPERYGRDMGRVAQEILQHLAAASGTELEVTIEVSAESKEGFTPETIRTVTENAKTLKFDQFGFESE